MLMAQMLGGIVGAQPPQCSPIHAYREMMNSQTSATHGRGSGCATPTAAPTHHDSVTRHFVVLVQQQLEAAIAMLAAFGSWVFNNCDTHPAGQNDANRSENVREHTTHS